MKGLEKALFEVHRVLAILGPRWQDTAEPMVQATADLAVIQVARAGPGRTLTERMELVDRCAQVLGMDATPTEATADDYEGVWGMYGTPSCTEHIRLFNGVPIAVMTGISHAEMHPERVTP